jgi:hypothetical protein
MEAAFRMDWNATMNPAVARISEGNCRWRSCEQQLFPTRLIVSLKSIGNVDPSQIYAKS